MRARPRATSTGGAPFTVLAFPAGEGADENPYIRQLYDHMSRHGVVIVPGRRRALFARHDVVHVHWPELLVSWTGSAPSVAWDIVKVLAGLWIARSRGARLVWTGHNLAPHDLQGRRLARVFFGCFGRMVDLLIAMSEGGRRPILRRHPYLAGAEVAVVRHGHYRDVYGAPPSRSAARAALDVGDGEAVLLVMGQIRPYKNIPALIRQFRATGAGWRLLVAGSTRGNDELGAELRSAAEGDDRVLLRLGYVPDEEVPVLHGAADVVILPYESESVLNSGAAILALSMSRPVVMPETASSVELRESAGDAWVRTFPAGTASQLDAARSLLAHLPEGSPDLGDLDWDALALQTIAAMSVTVHRRRQPWRLGRHD